MRILFYYYRTKEKACHKGSPKHAMYVMVKRFCQERICFICYRNAQQMSNCVMIYLYMPTTYTHWRFGVDCIETLPEEQKEAIIHHRELFDFGVHGPDIFFYDLMHHELPEFGSALHHKPAREFFEHCVKVYRENDDEKEAMLAYLLGFLSHFALDSQCHGYINKKERSCALSHNRIEAQYDAHMMKLDGRSIDRTSRTASLKPTRKCAAIIARFFPFSEKEMYRTCKWQKFLLSGINCHNDLQRFVLSKTLEAMKKFDHRDLIVRKEELEECRDSNLRTDKLRAYALEVYPQLAKSLTDALENGSPLCSYFEHDFDPYGEEIPVLSYEEELNYTPEKIS